jgi:YVTN family beta-propeller protein
MRSTLLGFAVGLCLLAAPTTNAASPDRGAGVLLYVDKSLGDDITVVDLGTLRVVNTIRVGNQPHALCAPADGRRLFTISAANP